MKKLFSAIVLFAAASMALAREISSDEARRAAGAWVRRDNAPLGAGVALTSADIAEVKTTSGDNGEPICHVVKMSDGGVVVTSAESGVVPVVAFFEGDMPAEDNPLWEILRADMAERTAHVAAVRARNGTEGTKGMRLLAATATASDPFAEAEAAWEELLAEGDRPATKEGARLLSEHIPDASGLSDLRVAPLITTTWDQKGNAANYYTPPGAVGDPDNYPCGCVALAGAEIANYWRFPTLSRPQVANPCYLSGVAANFASLGGTYDWQNMPADFSSLSLDQKRAVGRLCYDFGVATKMNWGPLPEGSGTLGILLDEAFRDVFGYASAVAYSHVDGDVMPDALVERAILANLDAQSPVALNLDGHTAVADGYGYASGTLYTHINLGWGGIGNVWYNLPEVEVDENGARYSSSILDGVVYNIHPTKTGELLTGRVLDGNGDPVAGATVTAVGGGAIVSTTTDARGIYALRMAGGRTWTVVATDGSLSGNCSVDIGLSTSAACTERTPHGGRISLGVIGNSWGNDITLGGAAGTIPIFFVDAASGNDLNNGSSWATAKASIQAAIDIVEAGFVTNAVVLVNDGRYEPIAATNDIPFSICSVTGPETTVIDGSLQWARGVTNRCATLGGKNAQTNTVLSGFCLTNGIAVSNNGGGSLRGTLRNCVISGNSARNGGGSYYGALTDCTIVGNECDYAYGYGGGSYDGTLVNCTISGNSTPYNGGGTAYGTLVNCTITENTAKNGGGAAYGTLTGCTISDNRANSGGGIYNGTLTNCMVSGNASTGYGGGCYSMSRNYALTRCTITNNTAVSDGGGAYRGTLVFCHINDNSASSGGGAYDAELTDCTLSGNEATNYGGGVYNGIATRCGIVRNRAVVNSGGGSYGATLANCVVVYNTAESQNGGGAYSGALTNCTVFANSASSGGGVYYASIANCIVWGNEAQTYANVYASTTKPCLYSCLGEALSGNVHIGNIVADPLFVDGVHGDYHLQANSPCIDAGLYDLVIGETDFYGATRISGGCVDMGASEFQFAPSSGYAAWAAENGLGAADAVTEGVPNLIRYVFDRPSGACNPFTGISFINGNPALDFLPFVNTDGVTLMVISSTNLLDWSQYQYFTLTAEDSGYTIILNHGDNAPQRFYKFKVEEE